MCLGSSLSLWKHLEGTAWSRGEILTKGFPGTHPWSSHPPGGDSGVELCPEITSHFENGCQAESGTGRCPKPVHLVYL